jgi:peptidoglycan/xylan/chitin deacetylase (PgdA/CDA1 family)
MGLSEYHLQNLAEKKHAIDEILASIKHEPFAARDEIVVEIIDRSGGEVPCDLMMTDEQIVAIATSNCDIGAHTVNHPILAKMGDCEAQIEIENGKIDLERITGTPVETFAFPNGRRKIDYDERHVQIAKAAGFKAAVTTNRGFADSGSALMELPRVGAQGPDRLRFSANAISAFATS